MNSRKHLIALSLLALLAACGGKQEAQAPAAPETAAAPAPAPEAAAPAQEMAAPAPGAGVDASALFASRCSKCHGQLAEGQNGNPSLVNLSKADIKSKLEAYRAGKQMGPKTAVMAAMAKPLTDEEIDALATFLGS
jgi:cytochrome c553